MPMTEAPCDRIRAIGNALYNSLSPWIGVAIDDAEIRRGITGAVEYLYRHPEQYGVGYVNGNTLAHISRQRNPLVRAEPTIGFEVYVAKINRHTSVYLGQLQEQLQTTDSPF
jgi:hypothetical protein